MKRFVMLLMLMPLAAFAAAAGQDRPMDAKPSAAMPMMPMMMMDNNCPMAQDADIAVSDTATGIALTFTTKPENVAALRRHVEQWAAMHSDRPTTNAMMQGRMMPATVKYESMDNGARLTLTPKDPAKLAEFRTMVRTHAERMKKGECAMMQDMMQGMMKGMMGGMMGGAEPKAEPNKDETDHSAHHPAEKK